MQLAGKYALEYRQKKSYTICSSNDANIAVGVEHINITMYWRAVFENACHAKPYKLSRKCSHMHNWVQYSNLPYRAPSFVWFVRKLRRILSRKANASTWWAQVETWKKNMQKARKSTARCHFTSCSSLPLCRLLTCGIMRALSTYMRKTRVVCVECNVRTHREYNIQVCFLSRPVWFHVCVSIQRHCVPLQLFNCQ